MGCWNCGCESMWFDRTMGPPCDSMHNVCELCCEMQSCGDDKCLYGVKTDKKLHCSLAEQTQATNENEHKTSTSASEVEGEKP